MPIRVRHSVFSAFVLLLTLLDQGVAGAVPVRQIDLATPRETLPFRMDVLLPRLNEGSSYTIADLNNDGKPELMVWYSLPASGGGRHWRSAVMACGDPWAADALFQYNGPDEWAFQASVTFFDCIGSPGDDLIMARTHGDTVLMQIVTYDEKLVGVDTVAFVAALGQHTEPAGYFHDLHIRPLIAVDLNGDGFKDLVYSRSVKPETAFDRAVIAWDLRNATEIWRYPVSDIVGRDVFRRVPLATGEFVFVFTVNSANNPYESPNGMTSGNAYLCCIDMAGKERWRHVTGDAFFGAPLAVMDGNGDGVEEVYVVRRNIELGDSAALSLGCYDISTGQLIARSENVTGKSAFVSPFIDTITGTRLLIASYRSGHHFHTAKFDGRLQLLDVVSGLELKAVQDLDGDGHPEVFATHQEERYAALDNQLRLLAIAARNENVGSKTTYDAGRFRFRYDGSRYELVSLTKRPLAALWFGKYKWYLAVALSLVLLIAGLLALRWVRRIRLSAAGLPGLDKVDALVMVLDRKGKVTFVNEHSLARNLIETDSPRGKHYDRLFAKQAQSLLYLIKRSYSQPLTTLQEQLEVEVDGTAANLLVATYPRLDPNNRFLGKVVVIENITNRVDWQRKVVLGEAAQRWVHNLKNSLATARLYLDNLEEDPRLDGRVRGEVLPDYLPAIRTQIVQTAETAGKILRFSSIRKPEPIECEINALVDSAVGPYTSSPKPNLTVAKEQQSDLPPVEIDPGQIREALDNLLSNAMFAMKKGGKLTIATRLAEDLPQGNGRKMIEIVVEDTGIGIPQTDLDKIFQPGFSKSGSTGVGLALVKEIVENHGGEIKVESRLGQGTRFAVHLPVERA